MATLVHFSHKNPLNDWHWIFFGCQVLKIRQKQKRKKWPTSQNKKMKKCKDIDLEVWWKVGGIDTGLVLELKNGGPNFQ
jgi:hypothetical protein